MRNLANIAFDRWSTYKAEYVQDEHIINLASGPSLIRYGHLSR